MGRNNYFQFKQFRIIQERAAMKVGTDGVLLGAWANISHAKSILDIGAGTGVISIMMAQRSQAHVTGIEIEKNAAAEARENAQNSPWFKKITILNQSLQQFQQNCTEQFDLIISNPPFFSNSRKSRCEPLAMAKHDHLLPLPDLIKSSAKLLAKAGKLSVILPVNQANEFIRKGAEKNLWLQRVTGVHHNHLKPPHRYLMEFGREKCIVEKDILHLHAGDGTGFTGKYKELTRDFYLNF